MQEVTSEELSRKTAISTEGARLDIAVNGVWGRDLNKLFWMYEFSTHMPPPTETPPSRGATSRMRGRRRRYSAVLKLAAGFYTSERLPHIYTCV